MAKFHAGQQITEELLQESCLFSQYDGRPTMLTPAVPYVTFQQGNEFIQNIWMIFHSNCFFKEHLSSN
jgi:hypothetical protein